MGATEVSESLANLLRGLVAGTVSPETIAPAQAKPLLDDLLSKADTYRDGALVVLAFAVDAGTSADIAQKWPGLLF